MSIHVQCKLCNKPVDTGLEEAEFNAIINRTGAIDTQFPEVPREIRELFLSGICDSCWSGTFREERRGRFA